MKKLILLAEVVVLLILAGCKKDDPGGVQSGLEPDGYFYCDDRNYGYKVYGTQTWMTDNVAYLPSVVPPSTSSETIPYYYVYGYEGTNPIAAKATENYKKYGVLYNWAAAKKNACPPGWHLPSDDEWKTLEKFLGMSASEADSVGARFSGSVGYHMKSTTDWYDSGNGDNSSGFKVLPGGMCTIQTSSNQNHLAYFWTFTSWDVYMALERSLIYLDNYVARMPVSKSFGLSVRCVKDL